MKGAREYANLFGREQHGKLLLLSGSHARGSTFRIYVLPSEDVLPNLWQVTLPEESVEVYGVVGGQCGWTETYGWLHSGKWQEDFESLVKQRKLEVAKRQEVIEEQKRLAEIERKSKVVNTLADY